MLRAYSVFKDLDKKACEILTNAVIETSKIACQNNVKLLLVEERFILI